MDQTYFHINEKESNMKSRHPFEDSMQIRKTLEKVSPFIHKYLHHLVLGQINKSLYHFFWGWKERWQAVSMVPVITLLPSKPLEVGLLLVTRGTGKIWKFSFLLIKHKYPALKEPLESGSYPSSYKQKKSKGNRKKASFEVWYSSTVGLGYSLCWYKNEPNTRDMAVTSWLHALIQTRN